MSEDLSKFKKKRTAVRSSLTKLINKIEGKINNENEPVDQFEAFIEQLNDKESNLSLLNTLIEDRLSVDTITEDMEASEEIKEKIIFWKTKLSSKIRRINSVSIQIPSELVLEFNRSQKDKGFDLSALLQFLHLEIRSRERASQINSHKLCHYSPPPQDRTKNKGSYFPGQRMKPPPNRVHFRPHAFPTPWEKVEPRIRKCLYCNKGHELDACRSFSANEKREILRKKDVVICVCRPVIEQWNVKENLSICTFGAKETETKTLNIVKIKLKNRDDPNLCIEIEAVETEHISITNLPTPDRNIDKKFRYLKNVQLADSYEFNDKEISILIGADYYYQVVTGRITRLNKNLVTVETIFGWSLQGQSTDSEDLLTMSVIVNESNISKQLSEFWNLENLGIESEVSDEENIDNDIMSEFEAGIFHTKISGIKLNSLGNLT
ncbi:uncharacterized protein TNCV_4896581 [Trichonephila clavipes]|uniref:Peptidase aspartic putative domain-containing protein n=1 Tax=Trichonephila clavipes TaxID=2585209 RepID=A0A8X6VWQ6_TRICX|nr:uncharacterized protein TNCV_4896581 [Trichonephila clavipes]